MKWQEIRDRYHESWVLVEALNAFTQGNKRIIDDLRFIDSFGDDWNSAWARFKQVHHEDKCREYYVFHTDNQILDVGVIDEFRRVVR